VPRDTLREALPTAGELHGLVLCGDGSTGGLLADYMRSLIARANYITTADAPLIARSTTEMIAACFHTTAGTLARAQTPLEAATLERIRLHIASVLGSPELDPESLCGLFRISRTRLYRLFEPLGGVATYIQEQRLAQAYAELSSPAHDHSHIFEIAFRWGFSSEAHFSRIFRHTFGLSPSEVRAQARTMPSNINQQTQATSAASSSYEEWVRLRR
jgi:AraC-like DNA-binding protein